MIIIIIINWMQTINGHNYTVNTVEYINEYRLQIHKSHIGYTKNVWYFCWNSWLKQTYLGTLGC